MQKLSPDGYATLDLPDQWIEREMQNVEARWIIEQLRGCKTILELGYGDGVITKALVESGFQVTTVDGSEALASRATFDGASGIHSLFEDFAPTGKYDCVIASFVLEHVTDPVALLKNCRQWSDKLIVVVGNANSWHRQLAVRMGLQPALDSLSARDEIVGHHMVYSWELLTDHLNQAGWRSCEWKGIQLKVLPNSMMIGWDRELIRAMCEIDVPVSVAANIAGFCV